MRLKSFGQPLPRSARSDQRGGSLLITLAILAVAVTIGAALADFATTSIRGRAAFTESRDVRYQAGGAINSAINWAKSVPTAGADAGYFGGSSTPCVYQVDGITVSCEPVTGSNSGVPNQQGLTPPEALLLLGDRHNEPGPYSYSKCTSVFDSIANFFTGTTPGTSESSLYLKKQSRSTWGGLASCQPRTRTNSTIQISGDAVAAGRVVAEDGLGVTVANGVFAARYGCGGIAGCTTAVGTRSDGSARDSDPARTNTTNPNAHVNLSAAYTPVGFNADGSLKSGYSLPARTTAYRYVSTDTTVRANVPTHLVPVAQCTDVPAGEVIIFLSGWYRDAEVLSRYTANSACPDRTFWFAPNAGPDNLLLTEDDETAPFYLDFDGSTRRACGDLAAAQGALGAVANRWCLGGTGLTNTNSNSKPRVVVGWPSGWTPFGSSAGGGTGSSPDNGGRVTVSLAEATQIEGTLLTYWSNRDRAKIVDGSLAVFEPCSFLWGLITCPSFGERTIRMQGFSPKVTSGPLGDGTAPNGRIFASLTYGLLNAGSIDVPKAVIESVDGSGVSRSCGEYDLSKDSRFSYSGSGAFDIGAHTYTFTADQAKALADTCGSVDLINSMRVSIKVTGNSSNSGGFKMYLDGSAISFDSYRGASFPVGTDGSASSTQAAKSDCDSTKPGGQLIFGGESNVFIADGSLEVCGGPYPGGPGEASTHQVIGVFGVPAVSPLRPSSVSLTTADGSSGTGLASGANAARIGEPGTLLAATISYPGRCVGALGIGPCDPVDGGARRVQASFPAYSPPAGYRIKRIEARVAYEAEGPTLGFTAGSDGAKLVAGSCVEDVRTTNHELYQWANEGRNNASKLVLFEQGASPARNCITPTNLSSGASVQWKSNVPGGWGVVFGGRCFVIVGWCNYTQEDRLEGVELDVTLESIDSSVPRLRPQSGCIVAHPGYGGGEGQPDCALIRAESYKQSDAKESVCIISCGSTRRGQWNGRFSVKGTIYAPTSAVELDDPDVAYPLATRGAILRHLRISGWTTRSGYTAPAVSNQIDRTPNPRQTVFTACRQTPARSGQPCDASSGDTVIARAGVNFLVRATTGGGVADQPLVVSWSDFDDSGQP